MTHPSTETLVALADGELTGMDEEQTRQHLDDCTSCTATFAELAETHVLFAGVLDEMDATEPARWDAGSDVFDAIRARNENLMSMPRSWSAVGAPQPDARPTRTARPRRPAPQPARAANSTAWRWAAGMVLVSGVAAAAIVTPALIRRVATNDAPAIESATVPDARPVGGAVAVAPLDGRVDVALSNVADGTQISIAFHERTDARVDVAGATGFVARDGHIGVDLRDVRAVVQVTLPHGLPSGRILVGAQPAAVIEAGRIMNLRTDLGVVIDIVGQGR